MPNSVATTNNVENVSSAKGVAGGYIFSAPVGTALPTDIKTKLAQDYLVLGYISEDGYVETLDSDSEDIVDMNGTLLDSPTTSRVESAQFTLCEIKAETLKMQYGEDNVTDEDGIITVRHNANSDTTRSLVLELVLKNGRRWRKVVPMAQSSELDDLTLAVSELAGRALTVKYLADEQGNTCYDYYESTETDEPEPKTLQSIAIQKEDGTAAPTELAANATVDLRANAVYDTGEEVVEAEWASSDVAKATVDAHGVVTWKAAGNVDITASFGGKTATATIACQAASGN